MAENQQTAALTPRMKQHYEDVVRPAMIAEFVSDRQRLLKGGLRLRPLP